MIKIESFYRVKHDEFQSRLGHIKQQVSYLRSKTEGNEPAMKDRKWFGSLNSAGALEVSGDDGAERLIHLAAEGSLDEAKLLIEEFGCNVNSTDYDKRGPAHLAAANGHLELLQLFKEHGCNLRAQDRYHNTPLREVSSIT